MHQDEESQACADWRNQNKPWLQRITLPQVGWAAWSVPAGGIDGRSGPVICSFPAFAFGLLIQKQSLSGFKESIILS